MEHHLTSVGNGPAVMALASLDGDVNACTGGLGKPHGLAGPGFTSTDETEVASTVARMIVAKRRWLRIVGAERDGRTAVSHRHGQYVDLLS